MAREISVKFALGAALKGGFKSVFQGAAQSARNVASAIREMEKTPVGKLGAAMTAQKAKIKGLAGSIREAQATLAGLQAKAQAAGGATGMLARQIEMAQTRVNNLNGAMSRQLAIWRQTTAQAATTGGSVRNLCRDYDQLSRRMERARKTAQALNANRAQGDALRAQGSEIRGKLAATAAVAMTVAVPVALSIDFEDQMAKVGAVSRASKDDLASLTAQARQLGRDTSFSASQAAEGMQYLAMAGFKTNQIMAAMPGMLDLAAASGTDLGRTADIASNILSAFELKAEEMGHVGDVLVAAFTSSNTTLESLGETMKYVGPVAKDAGASIEDAVAMAGMLGNVGISGSMAGTTSKAIFARLAAPPTEAVNALKALNIQTKDAQGNLRAVPDLLEEITLKTASMGSADRTAVFSHVFGLQPMAGASALAKQAAQTIDENGNQIVDSMGRPTTALLKFVDDLKHASDNMDGYGGTARRVAKQMNATTAGSLRMLSSAWQDAGISIGNLFMPAIRNAASVLSKVANLISGFTERFPILSQAIALTVGGIITFCAVTLITSAVVNFVRRAVNKWQGALLRLSASQVVSTATTSAGAAASFAFGAAATVAGAGARIFAGGIRAILTATGVGAVLVAIGLAVELLIDHWDEVCAAMKAAWNWIVSTWTRLVKFFSRLWDNMSVIFSGAWDSIRQTFAPVIDFFMGIWNSVSAGAASVWQWICDAASWCVDMVMGIWDGILGFFSGIVDGICGFFTGAANSIAGIWTSVSEFFGGVGDSIWGSFSGVWEDIVGAAQWCWDGICGIWSVVTDYFGGIVDAIWGVFGAFFEWLKDKFGWVFDCIDKVGGFFSSVGDGIADAWNYAFGDDEEKAAEKAGEKAGEAAKNAQEKPAGKNADKAANQPLGPMPGRSKTPLVGPGWQPGAEVPASSGGGGRGGRRGRMPSGGGGRGAGSAAGGASSGPVTVVTVGGDNSRTQTMYIPAGASSRATAATSARASRIEGTPATPRGAETASRKMTGKTSQPEDRQINFTQNFDVMSDNPQAFRKIMETLKPDFEALVRKALEKIRSNTSRTAYGQ